MWRFVCVLILLCTTTPRAVSEFFILNEVPEQWTAYFSAEPEDCTVDAVQDAFPRLYSPLIDGATPSAPANFTVDNVEREALEQGGFEDYYYPGMMLKLSPPDDDSYMNFLGYEVMIETNERQLCLIFDMSHSDVNRRMDMVEQELFPMSGMTLYKFTLSSLPPSNNSGYDEMQRFVTGPFGIFREGGILPAPVFWVAAISYYVVRDEQTQRAGRHNDSQPRDLVHQERDGGMQALEVVFSRPPADYRFQRFEIALVPDEVHIDMRVTTVTKFHHTFTDIQPGHYKVSVKPIDDHFSQMGRCLCHYDNGLCSNCLTTQTEVFIVE